MKHFKKINRIAITPIAKQEFADLLNQVFPKKFKTLQEMHYQGFQSFLVPEWKEQDKLVDFLKKIAPLVLVHELERWEIPKEKWPPRLTYDLFVNLFNYDITYNVFDAIKIEDN